MALYSNYCDNYHIDIINHKIHTFKTYIFFKVLISEIHEKLWKSKRISKEQMLLLWNKEHVIATRAKAGSISSIASAWRLKMSADLDGGYTSSQLGAFSFKCKYKVYFQSLHIIKLWY